ALAVPETVDGTGSSPQVFRDGYRVRHHLRSPWNVGPNGHPTEAAGVARTEGVGPRERGRLINPVSRPVPRVTRTRPAGGRHAGRPRGRHPVPGSGSYRSGPLRFEDGPTFALPADSRPRSCQETAFGDGFFVEFSCGSGPPWLGSPPGQRRDQP